MSELPANPTVSVVLCTYDPELYGHFREAADSILDQTYERVELVVVVDGSAELYERVVADYGGRESVVVQGNEQNVGLLESRNTGVELARGDVVAFIDDDAVADERWVEELVSTYREHDVDAAGGRMAPNWVADKPSFLPEEFYWLVGVTHEGFADGPGEVRNTNGSNLSFRRDLFLDLGGFDTDVGGRKGAKNLQGGETELCARLRRTYGQGVYYNPDAVVSHKVFDYRTQPGWLLDRAFWQGYSKRRMTQLTPDAGAEEVHFLGQLVGGFVPRRLAGLVRSPSKDRAVQLVSLAAFTGAVGAGYLYAVIRT